MQSYLDGTDDSVVGGTLGMLSRFGVDSLTSLSDLGQLTNTTGLIKFISTGELDGSQFNSYIRDRVEDMDGSSFKGMYLNDEAADGLAIATIFTGGQTKFVADIGSELLQKGLGKISGLFRKEATNSVESFTTGPAFGGELYPEDKLMQLVKYLDKRGVTVWEAKGNPKFVAKSNGTGELHLPANPTTLQVKHELSHYLDFKQSIKNSPSIKDGWLSFDKLGRTTREEMVLTRLQNNRSWSMFNEAEKSFSINYVEDLKSGVLK